MQYDRDGRPRRCYGGHVLVDGGYQKIGCYIPPQRVRVDSAAVYWSECVESTRKDVECVFGILKARFRILASHIEYTEATTIEYIMSCCILHNIFFNSNIYITCS